MEVEHLSTDGSAETVTVAIDVDAFASAAWRKILRDKDRPGMLVRRHLELCVFSHLAAELRSGDIAVAGSDSYANLHHQFALPAGRARLSYEMAEQIFKEDSGGKTLHRLRHSRLTHLGEKNISAPMLMAISGLL